MRIILASDNKGKIKEIKSILNKDIYSLEEVGFVDDIDEYGETFHMNALIKAQKISQMFPEDIIIADDSGLCVRALNHAPGVYSKRYGKNQQGYEDDVNKTNNEYLLSKLEDVLDRYAYFQTVLCVIKPGSEPVFYSGKLEGEIGVNLKGKNGFGYDPLFIYNGKTLAELTQEEKNRISHRRQAVEKIEI